MAVKSEVCFNSIFSSPAFFSTAFASGCSLFDSREEAFSKSSRSETSNAKMSVTRGSPFVIVPVLSKTTIFDFPACSSAAEVLNRIPFFAPIPFPTIIATGVARPSAQGQLTTRTVIARFRAKEISSPAKIHAKNVKIEIKITAGTKIPETLSAILAIGAFVAAASLTI